MRAIRRLKVAMSLSVCLRWRPNPTDYSRVTGFGSNLTTGMNPPDIAIVTFQPNPQFWVRVGSGSCQTCDLSFIP